MNLMPTRPAGLTDEQWEAILRVHRYRTLTLELEHQFRLHESIAALHKRWDRLVARQAFVKTRLPDGNACYALGPKLLRLFGRHAQRGFAFSSDGLLQHLGIAALCALGNFERLLPEEFHAQFPQTERPGLQAQNYCLDRRDGRTVYWALVDHATDVRRLPGKVAKVATARFGLPGFQRLIAEQRFKVVVITATEGKRERLLEMLADRPPSSVETTAVCIPWLTQFLL